MFQVPSRSLADLGRIGSRPQAPARDPAVCSAGCFPELRRPRLGSGRSLRRHSSVGRPFSEDTAGCGQTSDLPLVTPLERPPAESQRSQPPAQPTRSPPPPRRTQHERRHLRVFDDPIRSMPRSCRLRLCAGAPARAWRRRHRSYRETKAQRTLGMSGVVRCRIVGRWAPSNLASFVAREHARERCRIGTNTQAEGS